MYRQCNFGLGLQYSGTSLEPLLKDHPNGHNKVVFGDRLNYTETKDHLPGISGPSRQVVTGSGLSREVSV